MKDGNSFIGLIFFIVFFGGFVGPMFGLFFELVPLIIFIFIISRVIKAVSQESKTTRRNNRRKSSNTNRYTVNRYDMSNKDLTKIDDKLRAYFADNYELPIFDDIVLVPKGGKYRAFEELYIAKGGETIMSLKEFGDSYPSTHGKITSLLLLFAKGDDMPKKEETPARQPKVKKPQSKAAMYIEKISDLNIAIPQEEITTGLEQTCTLLKQIDISTSGEDDNILDKLYEYYLPILIKILENYKGLLDAGAKGDEFKKCEDQLIKTILLINEALKTINNTIHEDDFMNLSADITTLQSLLKKDGLVKEGSIYSESGKDDEQ